MNLYAPAFGFTHPPFQRSLAADQLFRAPELEELHSRLRYLVDAKTIGLLTGEPGAGKSTALRRLREDLHPDQVRALYLHDTLVNPADPAAGASLECGIGASTREAGRPTRHSDERARAPGHATGSAPGRSEARQLLTRSFNRRRVIS